MRKSPDDADRRVRKTRRQLRDALVHRGISDAVVIDAGEGGWRSAAELGTFVDHRAAAEERDWRSLDPRRMDLDDDDTDE